MGKADQLKNKTLVLSPTSITTWVRCKKQYYWKYIRKLSRTQKGSPLELGTIASEVFSGYYSAPAEQRTTQLLTGLSRSYIKDHHNSFLGAHPDKGRLQEWNKIVNILSLVFTRYQTWANLPGLDIRDSDFALGVYEVETFHTKELVKDLLYLKAKPDALIAYDEEPIVFEHKLRNKYHRGDFGIDWQSIACCLVTGALGTLYNVIDYTNLRLHRDLITRSDDELSYFTNLVMKIGQEILTTPVENLYPMPIKRCSCFYWELCMSEFKGEDTQYIIDSLYTTKPIKYTEDKFDLSDIVGAGEK